MVRGNRARPHFFPSFSVTFTTHGVASWSNMLHEFVEDPPRVAGEYHMHPISEVVNSIDERKFL